VGGGGGGVVGGSGVWGESPREYGNTLVLTKKQKFLHLLLGGIC